MKQMCQKKFQSPCVCRNKLSYPCCLNVSVNSTEPRLQTTVRQLLLESLLRHTQGWLKLIFCHKIKSTDRYQPLNTTLYFRFRICD